MKKIEMVKAIGGIVVSVGVSAIVGNAIKATTPEQVGTIKKVCIAVGSVILSSMISNKAVDYTGEKIDEVVNQIEKTDSTVEII